MRANGSQNEVSGKKCARSMRQGKSARSKTNNPRQKLEIESRPHLAAARGTVPDNLLATALFVQVV